MNDYKYLKMNYKSWKTNKLVPKNERLQVLKNKVHVLGIKRRYGIKGGWWGLGGIVA